METHALPWLGQISSLPAKFSRLKEKLFSLQNWTQPRLGAGEKGTFLLNKSQAKLARS